MIVDVVMEIDVDLRQGLLPQDRTGLEAGVRQW
jgi:hypothetical protein